MYFELVGLSQSTVAREAQLNFLVSAASKMAPGLLEWGITNDFIKMSIVFSLKNKPVISCKFMLIILQDNLLGSFKNTFHDKLRNQKSNKIENHRSRPLSKSRFTRKET